MTRVLVFGTFDHLHPGHHNFLTQAQTLADQVIVSVAQDSVVTFLKHRSPLQSLAERMQALEGLPQVAQVVAGDTELGTYQRFRELKPDLVAFGYDQTELAKDFHRFQQVIGDETPTVVLQPFHPNQFKSSLLRSANDNPSL
jgi:FAD synthetase